ncbi:hypothetical protein PMZ80_002202 [Knufia obscura]|uniref:Uncharacterized protein n=1 Tax=Knufia obscura TaxID=1635080 RepID=A0ABR0RWN1_9EURO|nr:hypothetical protein PMZ80_002202 [Knufia obscura]
MAGAIQTYEIGTSSDFSQSPSSEQSVCLKTTRSRHSGQSCHVEPWIRMERMCKAQIRRWNLQKYNNDRELLHLLRKHAEFHHAGKKVRFRVRNRPVSLYAARRHFERKDIDVEEALARRTPLSPTPSILSIVSVDEDDGEDTPRTATSSTESSPPKSDGGVNFRPSTASSIHPAEQHRIERSSSLCTRARCRQTPRLTLLRPPHIYHHTESVLMNVRGLCNITITTLQRNRGIHSSLCRLRDLHRGIKKATCHLRAGHE